MREITRLIHRIINRVNINLREPAFDVGPYLKGRIPPEKLTQFYAFYGLTSHHPLYFHFSNSSLAGSYFLGKCIVEHSVLYKSDIRGDELKTKGSLFPCCDMNIVLHDDEMIRIKDSCLVKTLVHNHSHDPESPEEFFIFNTVSMHYANIHGSPIEGSFMGPFSTVDLSTVHDCVIGDFAYIQTGELSHRQVERGQIWIHAEGAFDFRYRYPKEVLDRYISIEPGSEPRGIFVDFVESRKKDFELAFNTARSKSPIPIPAGAALSRYTVLKGDNRLAENVLVAQRAYLENAILGKGANAQENCYIIDSTLEGCNVTAHGGKIINSRLGKNVFVGFNSFVHGTADAPLTIGEGSIVMPHTIIDLEEPLAIGPGQLVWGYIRNARDLKRNSISLDDFARVEGATQIGDMCFEGSGARFVEAFRHRIEHILEANGAYFNKETKENRGHAQKNRNISFNTIQPYREGDLKGIYPTIDIRPREATLMVVNG